MLGKKSNPMIGIVTGSLALGSKSRVVGFVTSPKSNVEPETQSPKGQKSYDIDGVGLGIVVALENSGDNRNIITANKTLFTRNFIPADKSLFSRNLTQSSPIPIDKPKNIYFRSKPIPIKKPKDHWRSNPIPINSLRKYSNLGFLEESESLEDYRCVTCHEPNKACKKVYINGIDMGRGGDDRTPLRIQTCKQRSNRPSIFHISSASLGEAEETPVADFLSSCHSCQKKLPGKDIYMYRGDQAFCSSECRSKQIVIDERSGKYCSNGGSSSMVVISSPSYTNEKMFISRILAT